MNLPDAFVRTVVGVHKRKGERWLEQFDALIRYCEEKWSLKVLEPYPLSYHFVAPVVFRDGSEAVLKMGVPGKETAAELEALRHFNGSGIVRLIEADAEKGIFLLERVKPGDTLKSVPNDEEATRIAARVIKRIQVPAPRLPLFPTTAQWAEGLAKLRRRYRGGTGPLPEGMVRRAEQYYGQLNSTVLHPKLLHGDLHHENILSAEREPWLAIDPKGLIGETECEVVPYLMNHLPDEKPMETVRRRVDLFVKELGLNRERVLAWAFSHAVLSAWWHIEDETDGADGAIRTAGLFETLLRED